MERQIKEKLMTHLPPLDGWCTVERAILFVDTLLNNPNIHNTLCIGVWGGRSVIPCGLVHQARGYGNTIAVDPWSSVASAVGQDDYVNKKWWGGTDHEEIYQKYLKNIRKFDLDPQWITTVRKTSRDAYEDLKDKSFDFIEIDGNHGETDSCWDVDHWIPRLRTGGFLWMDDRFWAKKAYYSIQGCTEILTMDTGSLLRKQ